MSGTLRLRVLSKTGVLLDTNTESVILNAADGSMGIRVGHLPALVLLGGGDIIYKINGEASTFKSNGKFAEVSKGMVTVIE